MKVNYKIVVFALSVYIALPYLIVQVGNLGLIREGRRTKKQVALTFDDGPHPKYTPEILDYLSEAGAKATFFMQPDLAESYPEIVQRVIKEGHEIGAHGNKHKHAWIRSPIGAFFDPAKAATRLQRVAGVPVRLQRPPHGAYTLATILGQRYFGLTGVHWGIESKDWSNDFTQKQMSERIKKLVVAGVIIVMHDYGKGAEKTIQALPTILNDLNKRNYDLVTISELDGAIKQNNKSILRRAFIFLDAIFDSVYGARFVNNKCDSLLRVHKSRFPLPEITLKDNVVIKNNDEVLEFHISNPSIVDMNLFSVIRQVRRDMKSIASELDSSDNIGIKAIYCISSLSTLLDILKFDNYDVPLSMSRRLKMWANVLRYVYGTKNEAKKTQISILSREKFISVYGEKQ